MSKEASKQYIIDRLAEYCDWHTKYVKAVLAGETNEAARLEHEWNVRMHELETEADS